MVHHVRNKSTFWVGPFQQTFYSPDAVAAAAVNLVCLFVHHLDKYRTQQLHWRTFQFPTASLLLSLLAKSPLIGPAAADCCCCRFWLERLCSVSPLLMHSIIRFGSAKNKFYVAPSASISDVLACGRLQRCRLAIILYSIPLHCWSESAQLLLKEVWVWTDWKEVPAFAY